MNADYHRNYPWTWEREMASPPSSVYEECARRLRRAGYRLRDAQPPEASAQGDDFSGRFVATRDVVLNAGRRRVGKVALALGVGLTLVLFVMIAEDIGAERGIISAPLLAAVVLGGFGMSRMAEPEQRLRKLLEVSVFGSPGGAARVVACGGAGPAFGDDWVEEWAGGQDFADEETALAGAAPTATEAQR